jgi:autotransporter-associated beta strand protein
LGTGAFGFNGGTLEALASGGGIKSSKAVNLAMGGGTFLADAGTASTLSGAITGVGAWTKTGLGSLTLSGANTYLGKTLVSTGTLRAGSATAFSPNSAFTVNSQLDVNGFPNTIGSLAGNGIVTNNGVTLAILAIGNDNTNTIFNGSLHDGTSRLGLTKVGTGTLTLPSTNTYCGATKVNSGSLIVDGSIASTQTLVNAGGLLGGKGVIGGSLVNSGIVSPGDSPGKLSVNGNFTQTSGGTLEIEVAGVALANHDLLAIGGSGALDGTLLLVRQAPFALSRHDVVTFLTAAGGVNGTFASVKGLDAFVTGTILIPEVIYDSNAVSLEAIQGLLATLPGLNALLKSFFALWRVTLLWWFRRSKY